MTATLPAADPAAARAHFRDGLAVPSSGWAPGSTQANLVVLPRDWAYDMLLFGQRNPQPVPLLDVTDAGSHRTVLAPDADLPTDLPRHRVWRDGACVDEPTDRYPQHGADSGRGEDRGEERGDTRRASADRPVLAQEPARTRSTGSPEPGGGPNGVSPAGRPRRSGRRPRRSGHAPRC